MENKGFEREGGGGGGGCCGGGGGVSTVEMSEVTRGAAGAPSPLPPPPANGNGAIACSEHCHSLHLQHQQHYSAAKGDAAPRAPDSPWHRLKTVFLVATLAFLALWVLVYTLLSQLAVL